MAESFDYIIVGAGSAGCVVAHRLAEAGVKRICVLEAGPRDRSPFIHIPAGFVKTVVDPRVNWLYHTEGSEWTGERSIPQPRGRVLGGSGSINGHIFNRGQPGDFDGWAALGNSGWSYAEVLPYFKRLETYHGDGDDRFRGDSGPYHVTDFDWRHPLLDAFIRSANEIGIPTNRDYNGEVQDGVFLAQRSIHRGRRCSPANAFLKPALTSGNIDLRTGVLASRILFRDSRACGVEYKREGKNREVWADREVILCAGVFNTPQLLQISGVGPSNLLNDLGIPVVHGLEGVGENLRDHCYAPVSARIKNISTFNERVRGLNLALEVIRYILFRKGLLAVQPSIGYLSWKSEPGLASNDIQVSFAPASYDANNDMQLNRYPGVTCAAWQHCPESRGFVRIQSREIQRPPLIQPNYLDREVDRRVLLAASRLSREILRGRAFEPYFHGEDCPGEEVTTDDEWFDFFRQHVSTAYHPMGSCGMGPDSDPLSVVDCELRVRGLEGLRVVDASIMPTMPSGNTNAATLMIGEKGADLVLGKPPLAAADLSRQNGA